MLTKIQVFLLAYHGIHFLLSLKRLMLEPHGILYIDNCVYIGSTGNGVPLSSLTGFTSQFESQGSRLCWENLCLPVRAGTSSLGCSTDLKVPPIVEALPRIPRD